MLEPSGQLPYWSQQAYALGRLKAADDHPSPAYNLTGLLYVSSMQGKPWGLLSVPNALVRGTFDAMTEPGIELPLDKQGHLSAHISVFSDKDLELLGGPEAIKNDRGKPFVYTLGRLVSIKPFESDLRTVYAYLVHSPELMTLRKTYGLSALPNDGKWPLHLTVCWVKKGVLSDNDKSKNKAAA